MNVWKKLCILWVFLPLLAGCCPTENPDDAAYRVVTQVEIVYENGSLGFTRQFYQEDSIRQIVDYLRYLNPYGTPKEDPEQLTDRQYNITLIYSDGSRYSYQQRADRYFRIQQGPWQCIEPERALYLSGILGMMPGENQS